MGRTKNIPKKIDTEEDRRGLEYIPIIKKRTRRNQEIKSEQFFNIILPSENSKEYYIGELLLGTTNNVFPDTYEALKISFNFANNLDCDTIVLLCDNVSVIVKSCNDTKFIKELITHKRIFSFGFTCKAETVYLNIYFTILPLPAFSARIGNCLKILFSLLHDISSSEEDDLQKTAQKFQRGGEIIKLYEKLIEKRNLEECPKYTTDENVQHSHLKPILRPYQAKSVKWMLHRERIEDEDIDQLHPLYTPVKLQSGLEIYFDRYSGYVLVEKPITLPSSKGGILADEMGLGKTVEVLACILLNPKIQEKVTGDLKEDLDTNEIPVIKHETEINNAIDASGKSDENAPLVDRSESKYILEESDDESDVPLLMRQNEKTTINIKQTDQPVPDVQKELNEEDEFEEKVLRQNLAEDCVGELNTENPSAVDSEELKYVIEKSDEESDIPLSMRQRSEQKVRNGIKNFDDTEKLIVEESDDESDIPLLLRQRKKQKVSDHKEELDSIYMTPKITSRNSKARSNKFDMDIPIEKNVPKYIIDDDSESPVIVRKRKKRKATGDQKTENSDQSTKIEVPGTWVNTKRHQKSSTYLALDVWYKSILSEISTVRSDPYRDPNRKSVQCVCGSTSEKRIIKCPNCNKYQHKNCLGYKKHLGKYLCPQCWMDEPLLESRATLIVTPIALKTQWCKEICKHIKENLKVLQYNGSSATPVYPTELKDYDVVLTTYSVLQNELRLTEPGQVFNLRREKKYLAPGSPLIRLKWWRLCLDEAQTVEMPGRMVSEMARKIDAVYRWAVTGTPISKNISDIYGLIDYLQISPYNDLTTWNKILYEPYLNGNEEPLITFLSKVLWRTAKKDVLDQINIPKQTYLEHMLEFSAVEKYFYKREHELICNDFLSKVTKYDLSIHLESLDRSSLKKLLAPLLTLRHACTHPNTVRGRYLATKKQVTSMKDLLDALILKNTNDSEDCLRLIISAFNGLAGIQLLLDNPQEAINNYREVLQLAARFSGDKSETKLTVDKPQVIHTLHNLAEIIDIFPPEQPTLRDANLRTDCEELEKKYMDKFINESTTTFESFSAMMMNVEKMQNSFTLKEGQWYSDGLDWILLNDHFDELLLRIETACGNANVHNNLRNASQRIVLQLLFLWDDDLSEIRTKLFEAVENLYDYQAEKSKVVIKEQLVTKAMNCHLRPQKKGKQEGKCPVCIANDHLKNYEGKLFNMTKREKTFEEMSLKGSWKPTLQELVLRALHALLRAKHPKKEYAKDGELHISIIEHLKKEFKELRKLWTLLDQQICARDELDICKVRLQLKTDLEEQKKDRTLKNLTYELENKQETINLLSIHELDYQMSLLENDVRQNTAKLEKLLGTQSYLETLRKQQYEGQSPDPCPICKNTLEQHWSILLCGHSYCLECIQVLLEQTAGDHIQCSICRNKQKYQEISYIKAGNTVTDDDCKKIKGNYSTKIEAVIKVLLELKEKNPDVKVLLFSSWMTVLKCLKEALECNSITSELAHSGNLDVKITSFKEFSKKIMVLLLPVNLGSKGLNLIEATHVILVEPLLNPADELQAIGRVNRIGQTKATFVHKFLIKNTIEESIHHATTSNAANWEKSSVTLQHLVDLFNSTDVSEVVDQEEVPPTNPLPENVNSQAQEASAEMENVTPRQETSAPADNVDFQQPGTSAVIEAMEVSESREHTNV